MISATLRRACLLTALSICSVATADTLNMPGEPGKNIATPERGERMQEVLREFGEPSDRLPAVGSPPISRWVYEEFRVYFEDDRVIHSVSR